MEQMLLVIVDTQCMHSKWLEVYITNSSSSAVIIQKLRDVFSRFSLPEMSFKYRDFFYKWGIQIVSQSGIPDQSFITQQVTGWQSKWCILWRGIKEGSLQTNLSRLLFSLSLIPTYCHCTRSIYPLPKSWLDEECILLELVLPSTKSCVVIH